MQDGVLIFFETPSQPVKQALARLDWGSPLQPPVDLGHASFAAEDVVLQVAARDSEFFVKPVVLASCNDQPRNHGYRKVVEFRVRQAANVDAVQLLHVALRPDLRTHQAQTQLHEAMVEVNEDDVVAVFGHLMIEGDRAQLAGVGMTQSFRAARP
ncbi:MAG: hypothetical protein WBD65_04705 [Methylocella sp.]